MTAIASILANEAPLLIGDLALSGTATRPPIETPIVGNITKVFPLPDWTIVAMKQKIHLVDDRTAFAWAGDYISAKAFFREFHRRWESSDRTFEIAQAIINDIPSFLDPTSFCILGWLTDGKEIRDLNWRGMTFHHERFGLIAGGGIGLDDLRFALESARNYEFAIDRPKSAPEHAANLGIALTGSFMALERHTSEPISNYYGCGYEVCILNGHTFEKLGKVAHVIWRISGSLESGISFFPEFIIQSDYVDEFLILHTAELEPSSDGPTLKMESYFLVQDILSAATEPPGLRSALPKFAPHRICSHFMYRDAEGKVWNSSTISHSQTNTGKMMLHQEANRIVFRYDPEMMLTFVHEIVSRASRRGGSEPGGRNTGPGPRGRARSKGSRSKGSGR